MHVVNNTHASRIPVWESPHLQPSNTVFLEYLVALFQSLSVPPCIYLTLQVDHVWSRRLFGSGGEGGPGIGGVRNARCFVDEGFLLSD